ncbi:MAG TPA: VWA domain-containing protein [Dehalococcoidia bacterium]|nr:VWA domain-containing protein [Dehalococcoidia bacterium]
MGVISRFAPAAAAVLMVAALAHSADAQESPVQIQAVSSDSWPSVQVTLTAFDANGQPYPGLLAEDFTSSINGEPVPVSGLQTTSDPGLGIGVVLAFDVSGSMVGSALEQAKVAGLALVGQLGPDDQAAIVVFGSQVSVALPFTADTAALEAAINNLAIAGDTALYGGVEASAVLARDSGLDRRAIILLSDGLDFGGVSAVSRDQSLSLVRESGAMMFAVGLGADIDEAYLQELAAAGRGQYLLAPAPESLTSAYLAAGDILRQQYVLTLDATGLAPEQEAASVTIGTLLDGEAYLASAEFTLPASALAPVPEPEPEPVDEPVVEPVPEPVQEPLTDDEGGSSALMLVALAAGGAVLILGGGGIALARRRGNRQEERIQASDSAGERLGKFAPASAGPAAPQAEPQPTVNGATAWIEWGANERLHVGGTPVTIGTTADCDIRIDEQGGRLARLRIWRRDGAYMAHNLSAAGLVTIKGRPISWAVLEDGDDIQIGQSVLRFRDESSRP